VSISVIMPAWRAAATVQAAVGSVQAQTRGDWELIIIDDASDDKTLQIAQALAATDPRIVVLHQTQNGGAARARNRGISVARGRYIAFLDADDSWLAEKLERQISFMERTGAALSYTGFLRDSGGVQRPVRVPPSVTHARLLRGNVIGCLTAIYDTALLGKVDMPDLRMRQDYALWLKILRVIPAAHGLQEVLAIHHRHPGSLSWGLLRGLRATWAVYRQAEGLGRVQAAGCLVAHVLNRVGARFRTRPKD
jgi:teichuronic acid biosynthesis glycosyltransferase TuaG